MTLYSFPGESLSGKVAKIYDKAESTRRTFEVDVKFDEADPHVRKLAPGMTGELAFIVESKDKARVVPAQAVQNGTVWVVRGGRLEKADAKLGIKSIERAEVLDGLADDDMVVISPVSKFAPGQAVGTEFVDPLIAANVNRTETAAKRVMKFN
jgi:multidrug efflux pump subunit AcrA (membrane-fusion protein)